MVALSLMSMFGLTLLTKAPVDVGGGPEFISMFGLTVLTSPKAPVDVSGGLEIYVHVWADCADISKGP